MNPASGSMLERPLEGTPGRVKRGPHSVLTLDLKPCSHAVLFTNSCEAGRNNIRHRPYLGASGRTVPIAKRGSRFKLPPNPPAQEETMSPRRFSRLSLCAAAIGALAVAAFAIAPSLAAEEAVIIPAPTADPTRKVPARSRPR